MDTALLRLPCAQKSHTRMVNGQWWPQTRHSAMQLKHRAWSALLRASRPICLQIRYSWQAHTRDPLESALAAADELLRSVCCTAARRTRGWHAGTRPRMPA